MDLRGSTQARGLTRAENGGAVFVCSLRMVHFFVNLSLTFAFAFLYAERSYGKTSCQQVNAFKSVILQGKNSERDAIATACAASVSAAGGVNSRVRNIFNGFECVPVNEKIPVLNSI
jgi:hypothetical protein